MKKVILSTLFVSGMFAMGAFAQNIESSTRRALNNAGCLDGWNGSFIIGYRYDQVTLENGCVKVTAYPIANPTIAEFVKLGPVGNVVYCNGEITEVNCGI